MRDGKEKVMMKRIGAFIDQKKKKKSELIQMRGQVMLQVMML